MKLPALVVADLHLTNNPQDSYRWQLFKELAIECERCHVKTVVILGDLTDAKDYHPAELIIRIFKELTALVEEFGVEVRILCGNHDYQREGAAPFSVLSHVPGITFITTPDETDGDATCLWLPHTKTPVVDWQAFDFTHFNYVFIHQPVNGCKANNGSTMTSALGTDFGGARVLAGDIHVPQRVGDVEYIGSPYHVHFGDKFTPRMLLITRRGCEDLEVSCASMHVLEVATHRELRQALQKVTAGDLVKVRGVLPRAEHHLWPAWRKEAKLAVEQAECILCGVELRTPQTRERVARNQKISRYTTPESAVVAYVSQEGLGASALDLGLDIMEGAA